MRGSETDESEGGATSLTLIARQRHERLDGFLVGSRLVLDAADILEVAVLGSDARVVEAARHGVDRCGLPFLVLKHVALKPVNSPGSAQREGSGVATHGQGRCLLTRHVFVRYCLFIEYPVHKVFARRETA